MGSVRNRYIIKDFSYLKYNLVLTLKLCEVIPKKFVKFLLLNRDSNLKKFFWERLGFINYLSNSRNSFQKVLWIHTLSFGEFSAAKSLIKLIKKKNANISIVLSTLDLAVDNEVSRIKEPDASFYLPYDFPPIIGTVLKRIDPMAIVIVESDVWPNLVKICKTHNIPVVAVSGRYFPKRFLYNFILELDNKVYDYIDLFCMQSEEDTRAIRKLVSNPAKVVTVGNLKFNQSYSAVKLEGKNKLLKELGLEPRTPIFVAGSLHEGEDEIVIEAFRNVIQQYHDLVMIAAPRHLERVPQLERIASHYGISTIRRTKISGFMEKRGRIILLDTFGELAKIYSLGWIAFVGGSLVYLGEDFGGHNILEAVAQGKPVIFGPYMHNFQSLADLFVTHGAAIRVENGHDLERILIDFFNQPESMQEMVQKASKIMLDNRDISERIYTVLDQFIGLS